MLPPCLFLAVDLHNLPSSCRQMQIASAVLDVFDPEPLPPSSLLWRHPRVRIFPHVSSMTNIESAVAQMLDNRWANARGEYV